MTRSAALALSSLWLLADDGVVFSVSWDAVAGKAFDEMDPDSSVAPAQRLVPVEYSKWRLGLVPMPSQLVVHSATYHYNPLRPAPPLVPPCFIHCLHVRFICLHVRFICLHVRFIVFVFIRCHAVTLCRCWYFLVDGPRPGHCRSVSRCTKPTVLTMNLLFLIAVANESALAIIRPLHVRTLERLFIVSQHTLTVHRTPQHYASLTACVEAPALFLPALLFLPLCASSLSWILGR